MPLQQRNRKIRQLKKDGKTLLEISNQFDISPERVRQICLESGDKILEKAQVALKLQQELNNGKTYEQLLSEIAELSKPDRNQETVVKRKVLIRYLHDKLGLSFFKIGLLLKRHHTSVMSLYYEKVSQI